LNTRRETPVNWLTAKVGTAVGRGNLWAAPRTCGRAEPGADARRFI
jgi:hypothetical protein